MNPAIPARLKVVAAVMAVCFGDGTGIGMFPSQSTLARALGKSRNQINRDVGELEELGVIVRGDQRKARSLNRTKRPVVWDLASSRERVASGANLSVESVTPGARSRKSTPEENRLLTIPGDEPKPTLPLPDGLVWRHVHDGPDATAWIAAEPPVPKDRAMPATAFAQLCRDVRGGRYDDDFPDHLIREEMSGDQATEYVRAVENREGVLERARQSGGQL